MTKVFACILVSALLLKPAATGWLDGWRNAFRNANKKPVHVVILSDSTAHVDQTNGIGYGPDDRTNLWPNQLQSALASVVPGGSGGTGLLTLEANAGRFDTDIWQVSTPYRYNSSIGPYQPSIPKGGVIPANGGTIRLDSGEEASLISQHGDTLWIYWASCPDSTSFEVHVDNVQSITIGAPRSNSCTAQRTRVFHGEDGNHTIKLKAGNGPAYIYAAEWATGNAGVAVDNLAIGGATTSFFNSSEKLAFVHTIPNVGLAIIALGINDFAHDISLDSYKEGLTAIIDDFKKHHPEASILVVSQYQVLSDSMHNPSGYSQAQYNSIAQEVAEKYKVGYINLDKAFGGSFSAVAKLGILTSDNVHPSDAGGKQISARIFHTITDNIGLKLSNESQ